MAARSDSNPSGSSCTALPSPADLPSTTCPTATRAGTSGWGGPRGGPSAQPVSDIVPQAAQASIARRAAAPPSSDTP